MCVYAGVCVELIQSSKKCLPVTASGRTSGASTTVRWFTPGAGGPLGWGHASFEDTAHSRFWANPSPLPSLRGGEVEGLKEQNKKVKGKGVDFSKKLTPTWETLRPRMGSTLGGGGTTQGKGRALGEGP